MFSHNGSQNRDLMPTARGPACDCGCPALPPLCYGYLRTDLVSEDAVATYDEVLARVAVVCGYQLGAVFHEPSPQAAPLSQALAELATECRRSGAHLVLTFRGHLSDMAVNRGCLLDYLRSRGDAEVIELPV